MSCGDLVKTRPATRRDAITAPPDVFSADEIGRAASVPADIIRRLMAAGEIGTVDGELISLPEASRAVRRLRSGALHTAGPQLFGTLVALGADPRSRRLSVAMSTVVHGAVALAAILLGTVQLTTASDDAAPLERPHLARLIFVSTPGPGGGGGGGGLRQPLPPPKAERRGREAISSPVPPRVEPTVIEPVRRPQPPKPPEREALPRILAPLVAARADTRDVRGLLTRRTAPRRPEVPPSQGPGLDGGVGRGAGRGLGSGRGAGVGPGTGGGTGGGPYRPGSGVTRPRLLEEIKPAYTEDARRRGIEGDVVLEVVVLADGSIGNVRVVRSLGFGLDERAVRAMRRWRFRPAELHGAAVDVVVEVAMEFRLR